MMKRNRKIFARGISLMEFLLVMALSTVIMLALLSLFVSGQKYFMNQDAKSDAIEDSQYPIRWLTRDINEAVEVIPGPIEIDGSFYSTSSVSLVLKVPSIDANGLIINIDALFDYIVYRLNPDHTSWLERVIDALDGTSARLDSSRVLADDVTSFALGYFDANGSPAVTYGETAVIDLSLASTRRGWGRSFQERADTRAKLRNKISSGS